MREAFANKLDFSKFKYLTNDYFDFKYQSVEPSSSDPSGTTGILDQHSFHPNLNYGIDACGIVYNIRSLFLKNRINCPALTYHPTVDKVFQESVIKQLDFSNLMRNTQAAIWNGQNYSYDFKNEYKFYSINNDNKYIEQFTGRTNPSRLEDWGTTFEAYYIFDSVNKYELTNKLAQSTFFLRYPIGEIVVGNNTRDITFATSPTQSFANGNALYYLIHSPRSAFNPQENRPITSVWKDYFPLIILSNPSKNWVNNSFAAKNNLFSIEFDFLYEDSTNTTSNDVVIGLSQGKANTYSKLATIFRLYNNKFDARNKDTIHILLQTV